MASTTNPFDLLGNDVEDTNVQPPKPPKELVKKNTSSKKQDVPPPSADPSRANKNRPKPTGNEAAIRDRTREKNKRRDVPADTKPKHPKSKSGDRHSRTARTDSHKKDVQGWGEGANREAEAEVQGEQDAQDEEADESEESKQNTPPKMSLQDYLTAASGSGLNKKPEAKKAAPIEDAQLMVKQDEVLVEPTKVKNVKGKQLKTKEFLDFDAKFVDTSKPSRGGGRGGFTGRGNRQGGNRGGRGGNRGGQRKVKDNNPVQKNAEIDPKNLPTLS
ncbi:ZYRO0F14344p [Zygosaccharomyces rouxii]|uniref:ZYRO0F14344p n=1 Tax=Zygosaccharomyces rouxii (strain ATCC 2623 / CBS 732 / NBRC 1130 / NCYC 568 / NRRL Y-229) TaxID=559307 RepID=C5DYN0_ZYGRC|nr:uncharacterized protein ZYRO0F14344g [Zygosaccharomyces rouxii]KAH9199647.1 Stm1-domain-containing protein [Zygosaccharomyces rouxii]CAR28891.1 ZYRO0F14344p [Zygosaccharomyces rouxii]